MAVDVGDGLTAADVGGHRAVPRERRRSAHRPRPPGPGQLPARARSRWARSTTSTRRTRIRAQMRDDQDTPTISWPNYHSGANGDYQPVFTDEPVHELLRTTRDDQRTDRMVPGPPARGRGVGMRPVRRRSSRRAEAPPPAAASTSPWCWTASAAPDGRPMGRALAASTFHHFADYNWDLDCGAPSFVTEPPGHADQGATRRAWRSSRTTSATSPTGCIRATSCSAPVSITAAGTA